MSRMSLSGCCSPALLTRMSSRPKLSTICCDRALAEALVAEVAGDGDRPAALLLDDRLGLRGVVMLAQIEDGDVGAFAGEQRRDRAADAAVGAGDERDLALQPVRAGIARFPVGLGLELALVTRQRVLVDHRLDDVGHGSAPARAGRDAAAGARSADAGAWPARHSATSVGKSKSLLAASASPVAAMQASRLS